MLGRSGGEANGAGTSGGVCPAGRLPRNGTHLTLRATIPAPCALDPRRTIARGNIMAWTTPTLVEICVGLEINGYLPAEL